MRNDELKTPVNPNDIIEKAEPAVPKPSNKVDLNPRINSDKYKTSKEEYYNRPLNRKERRQQKFSKKAKKERERILAEAERNSKNIDVPYCEGDDGPNPNAEKPSF